MIPALYCRFPEQIGPRFFGKLRSAEDDQAFMADNKIDMDGIAVAAENKCGHAGRS
jgi:hypothetical protein